MGNQLSLPCPQWLPHPLILAPTVSGMQKGSVRTGMTSATEEEVEFRWNDQPHGPEWEPAGKVAI